MKPKKKNGNQRDSKPTKKMGTEKDSSAKINDYFKSAPNEKQIVTEERRNVSEVKEFYIQALKDKLKRCSWPGLQKFATIANANVLPQPHVQIRNIRHITAVSLKEDVVTHIRLTAQNRFRQPYPHSDILLTPNNPVQSLHLTAKMSAFVLDPFVTSVIRLNAGPLAGSIKFGRLSILMDKQNLTSAVDFDLMPGDQFCSFTR